MRIFRKNIKLVLHNILKLYSIQIFLLLLGFQSFAQKKSTDHQNDTNIEKLVTTISEQLQKPISDSSQVYQNLFKAVALSKVANNKQLQVKSYQNLAIWHQGGISLDSSIYYLEKAETVLKGTDLEMLKAENYLITEDTYKGKREYSKALESDFKALEIFENIDYKEGIAECYTRLCDLLYYQEKYAEGADYCQKAIEIQKQLNVPKDLALSYRYKADNLLMLEKFSEALDNISNAIDVLKAAGSEEISLSKNYNTRGNIYKHMERYDEAIAEYQNCYEIAKRNNSENGIIVSLANIGHVHRLQNNYEKALPYTLEAIEMMEKSGNIQNLRENYLHATDAYEALGQYKKALEYNKLYSKMVFTDLEEIIAQLESELQIKYETAKKDETIEAQDATISRQRQIQLLYIGIAVLLAFLLFGMFFTIKNNQKKRKALAKLNTELAKNHEELKHTNAKLSQSIDNLKSTQAQLIQSEKMASLGELTAGIAHEIQNPLNFVNNFSEVSNEMIDELFEELNKEDYSEVKSISNDLKLNLEKILHHGKRADGIVKGMLQHSRINTGKKEPTDLNKLIDEYLRLAYHGLRAKDKLFNAHLETDYDEAIPAVELVPQDIGRVILNLVTNAFYAVHQKQSSSDAENYKPTVSLSSKNLKDEIKIKVNDNGNGIPKNIIAKIFQPFFTTKPTGKGTGLGLSMSYDIVKAHGGEITVKTKEHIGTTFCILIPKK